MAQTLAAVTLVVGEYDEAIAWFCGILGFDLVEDTRLSETKRWVLVAPPESKGCRILLARADGPEQEAAIGAAGGGRVAFFLYTDNFAADHARYVEAGVEFLEDPREEPFGRVAVFEDLYGNKWDLIEPKGL